MHGHVHVGMFQAWKHQPMNSPSNELAGSDYSACVVITNVRTGSRGSDPVTKTLLDPVTRVTQTQTQSQFW